MCVGSCVGSCIGGVIAYIYVIEKKNRIENKKKKNKNGIEKLANLCDYGLVLPFGFFIGWGVGSIITKPFEYFS